MNLEHLRPRIPRTYDDIEEAAGKIVLATTLMGGYGVVTRDLEGIKPILLVMGASQILFLGLMDRIRRKRTTGVK